jgi:hypothetical protein
MKKSQVLLFNFIFLALNFFSDASAQTALQQQMIDTVGQVGQYFNVLYAPKYWKKEFAGWDLPAEIKKAQDSIRDNPAITVPQFQNILARFFRSTRDYHVGFRFLATEMSSVPLSIRSAQGKFFIASIDRKKLSADSFPFKVGDEVVSWGGKSVAEEVASIRQQYAFTNTEPTDQALAEMMLTNRSRSRALEVPKGPITIELKTDGSERPVSYQLAWDYTPEKLSYQAYNPGRKGDLMEDGAVINSEKKGLRQSLLKRPMVSPWAQELKSPWAGNPHEIGGRVTFTPALGTKLWQSDETNFYDAYLFMTPERQLIGYLRIPSYAGESEALAFEEIIAHFQKTTDALVIDEVNNPGGSVFHLYALVSMLTDTALKTPLHQMSITPADISDAYQNLEELKGVETDSEAQKVMGGSTAGGYPVDMKMITFIKGYYQFLIDQWNAGKTLTDPFYIWGVDRINPHPRVNYTKPILLLTNELDFSGGDFFPAILQDNKRVKILGTRTAGAGGYVLRQEFPNLLGLSYFSVTGSLARRVDDRPIENLGVEPDIAYILTAEDWQGGFKPWRLKILDTITAMIKK